MIVVVDYDESWPRAFEELRSKVSEAVRDLAISIEHVGSTSVPGLAAKPVIDMDVVVEDSNVQPVIERLVAMGYQHLGDLGISQREAFRAPPDSRRHNLYVCVTGSVPLANHLAIRDHLRENSDVAAGYGELKRRLAREFPEDIDSYVEAKTGFLTGILQARGFSPDVIAGIERVNRKPDQPAEG